MAWYNINSSLKYNTIIIEQWFAACAGFEDFKMAPGATEVSSALLHTVYG